MSPSDELLLVLELPMDMHSDGGAGECRLAHVLPPLACAPGLPPFRPPPPPSAAAAAEFRVAFRGWLGAPRHWELWVAKLRPIHEHLWRELGIFDAVLASTYRFKRDASAVLHLASFWSPGTNTFAFPWGEATLTLEDVAVLGGFPADGSAVPAPLPPQWGSDEAKLNGVRLGLNRSACKKAHHAAWIKYFLTDTDMDTVIEHAAFLALWLTRFVLPGHPESTMRQSLFPLAVRMARGDRIALGPAVLASLYRDLRETKTYLVAAGTTGGNAELLSPLSVYAPLYLLQLWIWERFPMLCDGKANPIKDGDPWAARWHDVSMKINPTVTREVLSSGKNFMWKPYPSCQQAYKHHSGWVRGTDVSENGELISLAHWVRACELVGADCIEQYLPHRVAMQFGLDQDVPGDVHRANEDWEVACETYDLEGKNLAIFIPHSEPGVTARYAQWWRQPLPYSDLDVGAGSISVEGKVSKRKVKKTLAAMEAEAEKEQKMKKARISPNNNDKKRKLEELYDAKLSDWLATTRNGSSGAGGRCKRGSLPKYDDGSDKPLLASVATGKDDIVLLLPRKQVSTPAVNLKKDKDMNLDRGDKLLTGSEYKGVNLKGYMASDGYHPVTEPYFKDEAVVSTEISTFDEDDTGEWSNEILKNTNELVRREIPDLPNRPDELKPPMCTENEECYDRLTDTDCSEDDREEAVIVDKPRNFTGAPEGGKVVMLEDKMVSLPEDKCLDATDTPEEGATVVQELEKKANLAVDESCGVSKRPEEVTALDTEEREEMGTVAVDNEGAVVSEVGKAVEGTSHSIEVVPGSKQGIYAGIMYIPPETVALAEVILPVQQANDVGECFAMSCIMEDTSVAAGVRGTNDGETSLDFVAEEKREISCIEEIGGENNQISEKDIKQKPEEAPQVDIVECGEDITLMGKNNRGENDNVTQTVEKVVTDSNMAAVVLGFPEEKNANMDKALNLAKKDTEDIRKEVVEAQDAKQVHINTLVNGGASEGDLPARGEARCFLEEDIKEDSAIVPQVKHANIKDEGPVEKDSKEKPNADGKGLPEKEVEESKEVYQAKQAEGEEHKVLTEKDTEECTNDAHAEEQQDETVSAKYMHDCIEEITVVEQVDGQSETLVKIGADENSEEITRARGKEFDNGTMEPLKNSVNSEVFTSASIQSKEEQKEVFVEDVIKKQHFQDVDLINESKSLPDGTAVEIQGADIHKTLDMHDEVAVKQIHDCGIICENTETQILEDNHIVHSEVNDLVVMEVDEAWSTVRTHNQEAFDLEKETMEARQDLGCTIENIKMAMPGDAIMPGCSEFQTDSPETKISEVVSTKGIMSQEQLSINEKPVLEKGLECKLTEGNARPLVVTNVLGGDGVDTTVVTVDVNKANCIEGIQNQEVCGTEELQARQGKQHTGVGDVRILEDTSTNDSGDAGSEKDLCMEKGLVVLEKQDEETADENTERTLIDRGAPECGEAKHDGIMEMIHETDSAVQAFNMTEDIIPFKNEQKLTVLEKQDEGTTDKNTERTLVDTDAPECGEANHDGTMEMIHETDSIVQAVNMEEDKILFKSKKNLAVLEKQDEETTGENTERTLVGTCPPECDDVKHDGTMQLIHETDCTVQAVNMAEDKISFKNKQNPVALEKQNEGTMEENTGRTLVDTDAPECGEEKHDGTMKTIHGADSTVQAVNMAEDKNSFKNKQNPAVLEKQNEGTTEENTKRTLVDTDAPKCGEAKHDGTMKTIHGTDSTVQAVNMTEDKISFNSKQNPTVLEKQNEGTTEENTKRTLVDTDASECGGAKHDGTTKTNHGTNSPVQAVNTTEKKFSFKIKQKGVPFGDHNKSVAEGSGSNKTARKEFKGALQPDSEHEVEAKQEILEDRAEMSIGRENDEASEQEQTSTEDAIIAPSGMDRGENNNEWAEEPIKSYGKYASNPVNTDCQTSKFGRPSIEEVRRIHSGRSVYLKDIKESQGRIRSEPSNRTPINNAGYNSRHGVPEPVTVVKDIKVPSHDTVSASGRDRALELVTGLPEETPRWRQEQYALNMLEDVQNARIAEKTRMEMEIRILKAQIVSMQKQVMNTDHAGEVISRSKRH